MEEGGAQLAQARVWRAEWPVERERSWRTGRIAKEQRHRDLALWDGLGVQKDRDQERPAGCVSERHGGLLEVLRSQVALMGKSKGLQGLQRGNMWLDLCFGGHSELV